MIYDVLDCLGYFYLCTFLFPRVAAFLRKTIWRRIKYRGSVWIITEQVWQWDYTILLKTRQFTPDDDLRCLLIGWDNYTSELIARVSVNVIIYKLVMMVVWATLLMMASDGGPRQALQEWNETSYNNEIASSCHYLKAMAQLNSTFNHSNIQYEYLDSIYKGNHDY